MKRPPPPPRRALVTGGLGFIGSALTRRLASLGTQVEVLDSLVPTHGGLRFNLKGAGRRVRVHVGDACDAALVERLVKGADAVFHLAGQSSHLDSMEAPLGDLDRNCRASLTVLEACRKTVPAARVVFTSTRQVYGRPERLPVDEEHPVRPADVNGIHKLGAEWYFRLYARVYGLKASVLRLTNTYGPRMRVRDARQNFVGDWVHRALTGRPIEIFGDGAQRRDFNYVSDVVDALLAAAASDEAAGRVLNLGGDRSYSLLQLARLFGRAAGASRVHVPFPEHRRAIDIGDYQGDYGMARECLGWRPRVGLAEGLRLTLDYFRRHGRHYW